MDKNCWEFMSCGRDRLGDCPAFATGQGRNCWRIAGTMCGNTIQGTFADKHKGCENCEFYGYVNRAGRQFQN